MAATRKIGVGVAGVLAAWLAHVGAFGDDVARQSRTALRFVGVYSEHIDDGAQLLKGLKTGNTVEQIVAKAACAAIAEHADQPGSLRYGHEAWKASITEQLPPWVIGEATESVDAAVEKAATALSIGQSNTKAAEMYLKYCT